MQNNVIGSIELNRLKNRTLFSLVYFPLFSAGTTFDFLHPSSTETNQGRIQSSKFKYWLVVLPNETRRITKNFLPLMLVVAQATLSYPTLLMPKIIPGAVHITKFLESASNPNYQFSSFFFLSFFFFPFCFIYVQTALW